MATAPTSISLLEINDRLFAKFRPLSTAATTRARQAPLDLADLFRCWSKPILQKIDRHSGNDANSGLAVLDLTNNPGGGIACRNYVMKQILRSVGAA